MAILNWGIIGCGDVCEVKSGPAFQKVPGSALVAVMRRNGEMARDFARRHGVPRWYNDAQQLIDDPEVNAVYIATPPSSHTPLALAAIRAGKPVYVEKPMAHSAAAARMLADAAESTGVPVSVAHYRRQQPLFQQIGEMLHRGTIGQVRSVNLQYTAPASSFKLDQERVQWRVQPAVSGGGFFHDLAPHQLDLLCHFFGTPRQVQGIATNTASLYAAPDAVSGSILFENGILATCNWQFAAPDGMEEDWCLVMGARGYLRFPIFGKSWLQLNQDGKTSTMSYEPLPYVQQPMIAAVTRYFGGNGINPCPADAGVLVMELMEAMTGKK